MTDKHPITPPPEYVAHWRHQWWSVDPDCEGTNLQQYIADQATQWGWDQRGAANEAELQQRADQELEACEEWVAVWISAPEASQLRAARRPKVPNKVDLALAKLTSLEELAEAMGYNPDDTIRLALERLKKLEALPND